MTAEFINSLPAEPRKVRVSWAEEVTRTAVINIYSEEILAGETMRDYAKRYIEDVGHPDRMTTEIEEQDDFFVYEVAEAS